MEFPKEQLIEIVESVWNSTLSVQPTLAAVPGGATGRDDFACCVQITGEWQGAVTMRCSRSLTEQLTSIMFGLEPNEVDEELMRDALGELANMVAGNVKSLAPGNEHMVSMPAVAEGELALLSVRGSQELGELWFDCLGLPLSVCLLEKAAA
jgi:chemotaxis protein CheX